jgi:Zn-dependent protease with chaperone function
VPHLLIAGILVSLIALPHLLRLERVAPTSAAAVWFFALCLRALAAVAFATYMLIYLPQTPRFAGFADWCFNVVVPLVSLDVHVPGLRLADGAAVIPTFVLGISLAAAGFHLLRARFYARRLVKQLSIGDGPLGSTVLASEEVLLAVTQLGPPRLLVSGKTLETLDEEELAAGLQHELGHLRRAHRPILLAASVLRALARWQPGAKAAYRELSFSLERDADEYALEQTRNPLALASAICKAALAQRDAIPAMGLRGESRVSLRLEYLLAGGRQRAGARVERAAQMLAALMLALVLFMAVAAPVWAMARPGSLPHVPGSLGWHC